MWPQNCLSLSFSLKLKPLTNLCLDTMMAHTFSPLLPGVTHYFIESQAVGYDAIAEDQEDEAAHYLTFSPSDVIQMLDPEIVTAAQESL
jgi:hypothetical protein